MWNQLAQAAPKIPLRVVVNVANGPGTQIDLQYQAVVALLADSGAQLLGYIHTSYGTRPIDTIRQHAQRWKTFYPQIQGIFLDEVSTQAVHVPYYDSVVRMLRQAGWQPIVLNCGIFPPDTLVHMADGVIFFEQDGTTWQRYGPPVNHWGSKGIAIVHTISWTALRTFGSEIQQGKFGSWLYFTDDTMPNPYDRLPSYWDSLVTTLSR